MNEKKFLEFTKIVGKLKRIQREGFKMYKIKDSESVADHSFRTTILGMLLADIENLNTEKIMRMLLLHDIQESLTGDIPSIYKEKMPEKSKEIETDAIKKTLSVLPENLKEKYLSLWKEMEDEKTLEAKFCNDMDKLERMLQVLEYEKEQPEKRKDLEIFWSREDLNKPKNFPFLIKIYEELRKEREL